MRETMTVNAAEYTLQHLLGYGKGGYSYLAKDPQAHLVVIKQIHHEPCSYYTFGDKMSAELSDYEMLRSVGVLMPRLLDADVTAERIVKEYIAGPTVYDLVLRDALPEWCVKEAEALCAVLHAAGLNIDYFPTNFIPNGGRLYYVDYECNDYDPRWNFENWGRLYWARTPELMAHAREHSNRPQGTIPDAVN